MTDKIQKQNRDRKSNMVTNITEKTKQYYSDIAEFLKGVKAEIKRITWPSGNELKKGTIAVIVILCLVTAFLWICENLFSGILHRILPS